MHAFKEIVGLCISPLMLAAMLLVVAWLCRRRARPRTSASLLVASLLIAWLGSTTLVGALLLAPLESRYAAPQVAALATVHDIVVLGSSYNPADGLAAASALDDEGLRRVIEAVRLQRQLPGALLVMTGGAPDAKSAPAIGAERFARELGVDGHLILALPRALDTRQEAQEISELLGKKPFLLVTSAAHLPRAMEYMHRYGAQAIPAPASIYSAKLRFSWHGLVPCASGLRMSELAMHEYVGLLAQRLS
jgi:uncharacterized SAM-binding protein YcdF (DUF218 family)